MRNPLRSIPRDTTPDGPPSVEATVGSLVDSFNTVCGLNGALLERATALCAERDAARDVCDFLEVQVTELKQALEACLLNDGTARYEYGEVRCRDAKRPSAGERWATPYEIAKVALS